MTVAELIELLQNLEQSAEIRVRDREGQFTAVSTFDVEFEVEGGIPGPLGPVISPSRVWFNPG